MIAFASIGPRQGQARKKKHWVSRCQATQVHKLKHLRWAWGLVATAATG